MGLWLGLGVVQLLDIFFTVSPRSPLSSLVPIDLNCQTRLALNHDNKDDNDAHRREDDANLLRADDLCIHSKY